MPPPIVKLYPPIYDVTSSCLRKYTHIGVMFPSVDKKVIETPLSKPADCLILMCGDDNDDMCTRLNLRCPWNYRDDSHIIVSFDSEIIDTSSSFCEPEQLTHNVDEHVCGNVLLPCNYVTHISCMILV